MRTVGSYEAKTHLSRLLHEVAGGKTITITKHGQAVAKLVPARTTAKASPAQVIRELRAFRQGVSLDGLSLREMIEEGRS